MDDLQELLLAIAREGRESPSFPNPQELKAFGHFFENGRPKMDELDELDGSCTRRELLARYLLLNAVLDQGPDLAGVRALMSSVLNELYRQGIRVFHQPVQFFSEIGVAIDQILARHDEIKARRAVTWARENNTIPAKYNLFMDNSTQALNYAVFRWGVPLALPMILNRDCEDSAKRPTILLDYLESYRSAEKMSVGLKDDRRYGLGKAIGDKACHLFAKWFCTSFRLTRQLGSAWGPFSYEVPFDSNAGRVLWRTGFFLKLATLKEYEQNEVVQPGRGKGGLAYLRITNIRGMSVTAAVPPTVVDAYSDISVNSLRTHVRRPARMQIQRMPHALMMLAFQRTGLGVADLDEGLIRIGTTVCYNHSQPRCDKCPISSLCEGYRTNRELIENYRT